MRKRIWLYGLIVLALAVHFGCGGPSLDLDTDETAEAPGGGGEGVLYQPTGSEGTITGKVNLAGDPPKFPRISMDADANCAAKHSGPVFPDAVVKNDNGTLANVFVWVKSGLEGKKFSVPSEAAVLDQNGCIYVPHVLGIMAQQDLSVETSDDTTHNVHPLPKVNREWNVSQPPGADPIVKQFSRTETSIPVKCNQHPWMRAYVHVVAHPFHAVSGADGSFEITGLPPGDYEVEAVHERYGAQTMQVSVAANGSATADFSYDTKRAYQPSSLEMLPALVLH